MKTFQTLFPPLAPHKLALSSARRVVLVAYNADRGTIDWRHFRITVKPYGVSRRVRRVLQGTGATTVRGGGGSGAVLDLGNEKDVADYVLRTHGGRGGATSVDGGGGYETAASEVSSVAEGTDAEDVVSLAEDYVGRNNRRGQKRAVHLDEIGPRMELRLVKIAEGVPGKEGAVIYHQFGEWQRVREDHPTSSTRFIRTYTRVRMLIVYLFFAVKKTKTEITAQKEWHAAREKLRKERREEQDRNVKRKKALAGKTKANAEEGTDHDDGDGDHDDDGNYPGDPSEDEDGGEAPWDEEEEISEGEASEDDDAKSEDRSSEEDDDDISPRKKKPKVK